MRLDKNVLTLTSDLDNKDYSLGVRSGFFSSKGPVHDENQDACGIVELYEGKNDDRVVMGYILADGAGSLDHAADGSSFMVHSIVDELTESVRDRLVLDTPVDEIDLAGASSQAIRSSITKLKDTYPNDWKQYGSTCVVLVVVADKTDHTSIQNFGGAVLGDSFMVLRYKDKALHYASGTGGEYANTTQLTTSEDPDIFTVDGQESDCELISFALSSDGLASVSLTKNENKNWMPHSRFWHPVFDKVSKGEYDSDALIEKMKRAGKFSDDTTVILGSFISEKVESPKKTKTPGNSEKTE